MPISNFKNRNGVPITDWRDWTPPASDKHWKAGRSAMELARAWFTSPVPVCPPEIQQLLDTNPRTAGTVFTEGFPEHVTALPFGINGRHHDLMLRGYTGAENVTVCIEAKADELFDELIEGKWTSATNKAAGGDPTQAHKRVEALLKIVFGLKAPPNASPWSELRYQLLTALAGTVIQATNDKSPLAVLIIHEFQTELTEEKHLKVNDNDYKRFVEVLCSVPSGSVVSGQLYGPVHLHSSDNMENEVDILIGKAVYKWK